MVSRIASAASIDHFQLQRVAGFTLKQIAAMRTVELLVGKFTPDYPALAPGEFTEFIAGAGLSAH